MKARWREYLKGEYIPRDRDKMNFEVRKRAKQMMKDLLLIARKMPRKQRIRIFKDPKIWENVATPLVRELTNNICILSPEDYNEEAMYDIQHLVRKLIRYKIPYDLVKLIEDKAYYERKEVQLNSAIYSKRHLRT